jgi:hypothetical protein
VSPHARAVAHLRTPAPGDNLLIGRDASVQFVRQPAFIFRVISVCPKPTYQGWVWLTGYQLDGQGQAVAKREIYVRLAGLQLVRRSDGYPASGSALVSRTGARRTPPQQTGTDRGLGSWVTTWPPAAPTPFPGAGFDLTSTPVGVGTGGRLPDLDGQRPHAWGLPALPCASFSEQAPAAARSSAGVHEGCPVGVGAACASGLAAAAIARSSCHAVRRGVTGRQAARAPRRDTAAGRRPALDQVKKV